MLPHKRWNTQFMRKLSNLKGGKDLGGKRSRVQNIFVKTYRMNFTEVKYGI